MLGFLNGYGIIVIWKEASFGLGFSFFLFLEKKGQGGYNVVVDR